MPSSKSPLIVALAILAICCQPSPAATPEPLSPDAIQNRILQHRTANATLTLTTPDGQPLKNTPVTIRQTRHKFLFGCNAFAVKPADTSDLQKAYHQRFSDLLNFATLPFYWGAFERAENNPGTARVAAMAQWCADNHILTKGHPLCWQQVFPRWAMNKSLDEIQSLQLARITRDVSAFTRKIDTFDVVNEAVSMPNYKDEPTRIPELAKKLGAVELIKQTFAAARKANPKATLILNDYDTSPNYEKLIQQCLDANIPIDVIGIQCHQHPGYWGAQKTWEIAQRFSKFNKPLHFTELTITSGQIRTNINWRARNPDWPSTPEDEARQAKQAAEFYTILFSHPAVHAITWWDFSDRGAWLGAPAGLIRNDMTPKPAYEELMKLVKDQWWTKEVKATTDEKGQLTFTAFLGDYTLESPSAKTTFTLDKNGQCSLTVGIPK